jgi:hypothetical protein
MCNSGSNAMCGGHDFLAITHTPSTHHAIALSVPACVPVDTAIIAWLLMAFKIVHVYPQVV